MVLAPVALLTHLRITCTANLVNQVGGQRQGRQFAYRVLPVVSSLGSHPAQSARLASLIRVEHGRTVTSVHQGRGLVLWAAYDATVAPQAVFVGLRCKTVLNVHQDGVQAYVGAVPAFVVLQGASRCDTAPMQSIVPRVHPGASRQTHPGPPCAKFVHPENLLPKAAQSSVTIVEFNFMQGTTQRAQQLRMLAV